MKTMKEWALAYLKEGKPVFPVGPDKTPLVAWKSFQTNLPSEAQVVKWWEKWPDANIGMATGKLSGIIVIDADSQEAATRLADEYPEARQTKCVKTGRAWHIYFQYQEGIRNSASKFAPGLDIRGEGGYVLLPPSKHATGAIYRWMNSNILPMPEALVDRLLNLIPDGQRNETLFRQVAAKLRGQGKSENEILQALIEANIRCCPPKSEGELAIIAHSAAKYPAGERSPSQETLIIHDRPQHIVGEHYLWDGLIKAGACHLLASKPEVGKTTLAINLAVAISRGIPFLDIQTNKNKVLYCYFDKGGSQEDLIEAYDMFGIQDNEVPCIAQPLRPDSISLVVEAIKQQKSRFVVIDTLADVLQTEKRLTGTLYSNTRKLCQPLMEFAAKEGIALLFLTHLRKQQDFKGDDPFDEIIDSTGYRGMVHKSFLYQLMPDSEVRMLQSSTGRGRTFSPTWIDFNLDGWLAPKGGKNATTHYLLRQRLLAIIKEQQPVSEKGVYSSIGGYNPNRYYALRQLLSEKLISRSGRGIKGDPYLLSLHTVINIAESQNEDEEPGKKPVPQSAPAAPLSWREELDKKWKNFGK